MIDNINPTSHNPYFTPPEDNETQAADRASQKEIQDIWEGIKYNFDKNIANLLLNQSDKTINKS